MFRCPLGGWSIFHLLTLVPKYESTLDKVDAARKGGVYRIAVYAYHIATDIGVRTIGAVHAKEYL